MVVAVGGGMAVAMAVEEEEERFRGLIIPILS